MPLSLLLTLTPLTSTCLGGFYGREAQAWLIGQIARHDPQMAEALHGETGPRPYTISSLIVPDAGRRQEHGEMHLIPGNQCLLRITSLSEHLSDLLLARILQNLPQTMRLKWSEFRVLEIIQSGEWCGQASFGELVREAAQGRGRESTSTRLGTSVTLEFASPTAFRSNGIDLTLPTPDQVWRSLHWRWNAFAPQELQVDPLWPEFAATCLVVNDFLLRSMKVAFKQGEKGAATGCTGRATYRLLPEERCGDYALFRHGAEQVLRTLAAFALYSGVGHHTTVGLGQARCIASNM